MNAQTHRLIFNKARGCLMAVGEYASGSTGGGCSASRRRKRPGVALSAEQMAQLTSDMVWLVEQNVTLADGSTQKVLTPQVYVRVKEGDLNGTGALIGGKDVDLKLAGDLTNSGTIAGRNVMEINANNIHNLGGRLSADSLSAKASQDIHNIGGMIEAQSKLNVNAGRDLNVVTTTQTTTTSTGANTLSNTGIDRVAGLYVKGSTGTLVASAGRDLNLTAAAVSNAGTGDTKLSAGKDLNLSTVITGSSQSLNWDANNHLRQSNSQDVGSQINAAGQELKATAAGKVNISAGQASETFDEARKSTNKGVLSSTTTTTQITSASTTALGSSFEGNSVSITAGQDLSVKGSNVLADQNVQLNAGGNVKIEAAQNTSSQNSFNQTTKSGLMGSGLSVTVGKQMQSLDQQGQSTTAAGSTVGSTGGNVTINAGGAYTQTGSDVITPNGNIDISAKTVNINEARETGRQSSEQKFKQSGVTVAVTSPVLSALQMADSQIKAAGNTSSGRMQALAAANTAINLKQGADAVSAGQANEGGNAADKAGGIGVNISAGASSSQSKQQSSADSAKGSNLNAGGNVTIQATGAGKDSDITIQGSDIAAGGKALLKADDQVNIVAAQNTTQESSSSKNNSSSIGVGMQLGAGGAKAGVTVSASAGKGQGAGNSNTYTNSHVSANQVTIDSGGDTTIRGGVVKGDQVTAKVGGNLNIESLQDKSQYNEKSQQVGGSVTVGPAAGGSVNVGQTKINSDFLSVGEQSAIRAGDGGFDVSVNSKTNLTGGQITSTQAAIDNNKNSYEAKEGTTTTDVQNSAKYSAQSTSVGIAAGSKAPGTALSTGLSGVGIGSDKGSAQSTTTAGISGVAGNTSARTGDKETGLTAIFDKDKVQKEVAAQVAITQEFGKQASKFGGTEADKQRDALKAQAKQANDSGNTQEAQALLAESAKWDEGGTYRVAMHTVIGGLTGGAAGAVGAGAGSAAAPTLNELQSQLETGLQKAGLGESASKVIAGLAGGTTAAAIGTAASGGSVAGGATAFNADMNNRQLHPTEVQWIKSNSKKFAADLSKTLGSEVSEAEAARWLTAAGESDVDVGMQRSNGQFVRGTSNTEEAQAYDAAKSFISSKAKANFVDASGQTQTLFTTKNGDFYKPEVYSQYRNDAAYRDFYWNTMGINLKGDQLTPQEQALYDQRQAIVNKQTVKDLAVLGGVAIVGKIAINSSSLKPTIAQERAANEGVYVRISEIPKGQKPAPETYLSENYINTHLQDFRESGVVRFTSEAALTKYGTAGPDGGFVFPKNQFDNLMSQANGNLSTVEQKLGLPAGYLSTGDTVPVFIKPNDLKGLRIPSGNETGSLPSEWIPGGYTKGGMPEAVMDFSYKPPVTILRVNGVKK